jgi:hypothetical protein
MQVPEPDSLPGDFNDDGTVDGADYVVWRKNPGGIYTQDDFNTWRAHFGHTLGSGSTFPPPPSALDSSVPEPSSWMLCAAACWHLVAVYLGRR